VALGGIDVYLVIGICTVTVDDVFAVECAVLFKRFARSKSVGIDGEKLLLAVVNKSQIADSSAVFAGIMYRCPVPRLAIMNTGGLSPLYEPRPHTDRVGDREPRSRTFFPTR
jgi:hypothetical protein